MLRDCIEAALSIAFLGMMALALIAAYAVL